MIANVFTPLLLALPLQFGGTPTAPAPDAPLPRTTAAVVADFQRTDSGLTAAIARWRRSDAALASPAAPAEVQLWALHEQRLLMRLRDRPGLASAVLTRLRPALRRAAAQTLRAMTDLKRLTPRHPPKRRWRAGPPLPAPYLTETLEQTWRNAWNLAAAMPAGCTACADDLDAVMGFYGMQLPGHRAALLSYTRDGVIGAFFQLNGDSVEAALGALAGELAPYDIWRHFYVTGSSHTMLGSPGVSQNGVTVRTFVAQMVDDDPAWASVEP